MKIKEISAAVAGVALIVGAIAGVAVLQPTDTPVTVVQSPTPVVSAEAEVIPTRPQPAVADSPVTELPGAASPLAAVDERAMDGYEDDHDEHEYEDHDHDDDDEGEDDDDD